METIEIGMNAWIEIGAIGIGLVTMGIVAWGAMRSSGGPRGRRRHRGREEGEDR